MSVVGALLLLLAICLVMPALASIAASATPFVIAVLVVVGIWRMALPPRPRRR